MFFDGTRRYEEIIPGDATDLPKLILFQLPPRHADDFP